MVNNPTGEVSRRHATYERQQFQRRFETTDRVQLFDIHLTGGVQVRSDFKLVDDVISAPARPAVTSHPAGQGCALGEFYLKHI